MDLVSSLVLKIPVRAEIKPFLENQSKMVNLALVNQFDESIRMK